MVAKILRSQSIKQQDKIRSLSWSYFDQGSSESLLVCLHGVQGSKTCFDSLLKSPDFNHIRVIAVDLPGFGDTDKPAANAYDLLDQAEDLITFFDLIRLNQFFVLGHSLGGMLGTLLIDRIPERILGLIHLEGNLCVADCGETGRVAAMDFEEFRNMHFPKLIRRADPSLKSNLQKTEARIFYQISKSAVQWAKSGEMINILTQTEVPVLLVRCEQHPFPLDLSNGNLTKLLVKGADHFSLVNNDLVLSSVKKFISCS